MRANTFNSEVGTVNTSTVRTRSRRATTRENANHKCNLCGKLFQRSYNHNAHMDTHNPDRPKPHACPVRGCGRRFVRRTDLARHHKSVHLKVKNQKCTACEAYFARKDTLRRHTEDGCPKRFDVRARQAQRAISTRRQRTQPVRPPHPRAAPRNMSLGHLGPYFLPSP
ncbi:Krueppel-like factor 15 [Diplodia seriata]|uniref:Krueppel-like factor 15 n=1 Tax=Diplodia seriata TaxID=420778 RepID=A0A1S8BG85_9PEZI|nr:Krueppel-like factor 15 [Diplodia seriata]